MRGLVVRLTMPLGGDLVGLRDRLRVILGRPAPAGAREAPAAHTGRPRLAEERREPPYQMLTRPIVVPVARGWGSVDAGSERVIEVLVDGAPSLGIVGVLAVPTRDVVRAVGALPAGPVVVLAADRLDAAAYAERIAALGRVVGWVVDPPARGEAACDR